MRFLNSSKLDIITWDVQHGSAILIRTPKNKIIVIDLGVGSYHKDESFSPLNHLLINYKIDVIDCLIITHPHKDHIEDILSLRHFKVRNIITSKHIPKSRIGKNATPKDNALYEEYKKLLKRSFLPQKLITIDNLKIKIFSPKVSPMTNLNNHSLVIALQFGDLKFVIPGDNEIRSLCELMGQKTFRKYIEESQILWAPHHGRESSYHFKFLKKVNPWLTIISDDKKRSTSAANKYSAMSQGEIVTHRSFGDKERKLLSTRNDGVIQVIARKAFLGDYYLDITVN